MEDALGDPGEDTGHGVNPRFGILIEEVDDVDAVPEKLAAEEAIRQEDLGHDVNQIEHLADEES